MGDDIKRNVLATAALLLLLFSSLLGATLTGYLDWGQMWQEIITARPPSEDPDILWQRAQEDYADADKDPKMNAVTKACCRRILILNPHHLRARKMLAALYLKDKNFADAEAECQTVLLSDPADLTARLGLASALRGQNKRRESIENYRKVYDDSQANLFQKDEAERNLKELDPKFAPLPPAYLLPTPFPSPSPPSGGGKGLYPPPNFNPKPVASPAAAATPFPTPSASPSLPAAFGSVVR